MRPVARHEFGGRSCRMQTPSAAQIPPGTTCRTCDTPFEEATLHLFVKEHGSRGHRGTGRERWCLECRRAYSRSRYAADFEQRLKMAEVNLARRYGIDLDDYRRLLEHQGGRCAVCRCDEETSLVRTPVRGRRRADGTPGVPVLAWYVDHDHDTGAVRGLLCMPCNSLLGHLESHPDGAAFKRAADGYLAAPPADTVL